MSSVFRGFLWKVRKTGRETTCQLWFAALYSRKYDSKGADSSFKVVKSSRNYNDQPDAPDDGTTNWELLAPKGYRYILPGSTGLALQQPIPLPYSYKRSQDFSFEVRECPVVLRKAITELFQGHANQFNNTITVITLRHRGKPLSDHESVAMKFLQDSQSICTRLMIAGYWADFINPFSGRPHLSPVTNYSLYSSDSRFRCLGFEIKDKKNCTVVKANEALQIVKYSKNHDSGDDVQEILLQSQTNENLLRSFTFADSAKPSRFIGNLFTNAPRNLNFFMNLSKSKPR